MPYVRVSTHGTTTTHGSNRHVNMRDSQWRWTSCHHMASAPPGCLAGHSKSSRRVTGPISPSGSLSSSARDFWNAATAVFVWSP